MLTGHAEAIRWLSDDRAWARRAARDAIRQFRNRPGVTGDEWVLTAAKLDPVEGEIVASYLSDFPRQTGAVLDWLLGRLATVKAGKRNRRVEGALMLVSLDALRGRPDVLEDFTVHEDVRVAWRQRLELAGRPAAELFGMLMDLAREVGRRGHRQADFDRVDWLVEALASQGDEAGKLALGVLNNRAIKDWREYFAVAVLEEVPYGPAAEELLNRMRRDDDEMPAMAARGFGLVGSPERAARLEQIGNGSADHGTRLSVNDALAGMVAPEADGALARLMEREADVERRTFYAQSILARASGAEAVGKVIEMWRKGKFKGPLRSDLRPTIVGACALLGLELKERAEWTALAEEHEREMREHWASSDEERDAMWNGVFGGEEPEGDDAELPPEPAPRAEAPDPFGEVTWPIVNGKARVGRNDPCPCGSGKKHKKCCLANEA